MYKSTITAFDHGRKNPVLLQRELDRNIGPGTFNPKSIQIRYKKTPSATFGAPLGGEVRIKDYVAEAEKIIALAKEEEKMKKTLKEKSFNNFTMRKKPVYNHQQGKSRIAPDNLQSGSFRSKSLLLNRNMSLTELLEKTRQDIYYKGNINKDYVNHDSAIGKQRLSSKKNAPNAPKW
jgi:hypothetical protein